MERKTRQNTEISFGSILKWSLPIFLVFTLIIGGILTTIYNVENRNRINLIKVKETDYITHQKATINNIFALIASDLIFISEQNELIKIGETGDFSGGQELAEEWTVFLKAKEIYDQVRYLDESGMEKVRANYNSGNPRIVPEDELQHKKARYYFNEISALQRGEIYVSPFDLNVENEKVEVPFKPIIRFGTPVFDSKGNKHGVVILNYLAKNLLNYLQSTPMSSGQLIILNSEGYWLKSLQPEDEWGFMFPDKTDRKFSNDFPEEWQQLNENETGQLETASGLYTYFTVYPTPSIKNYYWKVISYTSQTALDTVQREIRNRLLTLYGIALVIMALLIWFPVTIYLQRRRLQVERANLASFPELNPDPVIETNLNGEITYANPGALKAFPDLLNKLDQHPVSQAMNSIITRSRRSKDRIIKSDVDITSGKRIYGAHVYYHPERKKFRGYFRDITEERLAKQFETEAVAAKIANRTKSEFLANMSHELRTPLNAIIGFSQVLQEKYYGELTDKQALYVQNILQSGEHLLSLINDILDLSKVEAGKEELELSDVNIKELLESSITLIKEKAAKHSLTIDLRISNDMDTLTIALDRRKISQVMFNLLSNATKFTPDNGTITVEAEHKDNEIVISVTDTGIGIAPEDRDRIFDEFYQVSGGLQDKTTGTGLGLPLAKRMVELHGGSIRVESKGLEKGSRFVVTLPLP